MFATTVGSTEIQRSKSGLCVKTKLSFQTAFITLAGFERGGKEGDYENRLQKLCSALEALKDFGDRTLLHF